MVSLHLNLMKILPYVFLVISLWALVSCAGTKAIEIQPTLPSSEQVSARSYPESVDFFEIDKFENIYIVNGNRLKKVDQLTANLTTYENDRYGNITSIDVTNPQKILVFYDLFDIVITLDNSLAETSNIDLKIFGYQDINAIAASNDNNIWLYDPVYFRLKKINNRGTVIAESLNLSGYYLDQVHPTSIKERGNKVYLNSPEDGILLFDNLGQFIKVLPLKDLTDFQVRKSNIIYHSFKGAFIYFTEGLYDKPLVDIDLSELAKWKQFRMSKSHYYIAFPDGVDKVSIMQ